MRVLITAACAPPGRNTFLEVKRILGTNNTVAADSDADTLKIIYQNERFVSLPSARLDYYVDALIRVCKDHEIGFVIPCIEEEVLVLSSSLQVLQAQNIRVLLPEISTLKSLVDKYSLSIISRSLGIDTPATYSGREFIDRYRVLGDCFLRDSFIVKPRIGHGSKGVRQVSGNEALEFAETTSDTSIIQEVIRIASGSIHMVGILCDYDGRAIRSFVSKSTETLYENGGPATAGISILNQQLCEQSARLMESKKWIGPAGVEWLYDQEKDKYFLIDVNPRLWGYSSLMHASGSDFMNALLMLLKGEAPGEDSGYLTNVTMKRFFIDFFL